MAGLGRTQFGEHRPAEPSYQLDWGRAISAGLLATIAITLTMALFGMNIVRTLGMMMLGPAAGATAQYLLGGVVHLVVGLGYGVLYAALFSGVRPWGLGMKGLVFGLSITAIALAGMPVMAAMLGGGDGGAGAANPCAPAANPCALAGAGNPCGPANPCAPQAANPCAGAANPCSPGAGAGASPFSGLVSVINHLVYSFVLAFAYARFRSASRA